MATNQTEAEILHAKVLKVDPKYNETAHWSKVMVRDMDVYRDAIEWLEEKGHKRGDQNDRNDWLHPTGRLFLIRDVRVATEFKLRWG